MNFRQRSEALWEIGNMDKIDIEAIQKHLIDFLSYKDFMEYAAGVKLLFSIQKDILYIKEYNGDKLPREVIYQRSLGSTEHAHKILVILEITFRKENYEIIPGKTAVTDKEFSVVLKP